MSDSEFFIFIISGFMAAIGTGVHSTSALPGLYFRNNPAPGIVRLGVLLSMAWIGFVLWRYADPSVTGFYVLFYLVMGFGVVKVFGQSAAALYGMRSRVDAAERRSVPAAVVIAAFTLATGLIFGGSLWGEADPVGDDEGGWWIPVGFFLLGWAVLVLAFAIFERREPGRLTTRIRSQRSMGDARATATFLLGSAVVLTDAVSGDFWGWRHGLLSFGVLAAMLIVHELLAPLTKGEATTRPMDPRGDARRILESLFYLAIAGLVWILNRAIDSAWGAG